MKASLKLSAPNTREANPASTRLIRMRKHATSKAASICQKNRPEPAMVASRSPSQGVNSGETRMPKINSACELTKYPAPRMTPAISEKMKNSYEG